jgi:hypothetical protein
MGKSQHIEGERHAGKRVLSVDRVPPKEIASPLPERIDIDRLLGAMNLDRDEGRYLEASALRGIPRRKLGVYLGWEQRRVERVRVRLQRRIAILRRTLAREDFVIRGSSSTHLSYLEQLPSGRKAWTLAELGEGFPSVMADERDHVSSGESSHSPRTLSAVA